MTDNTEFGGLDSDELLDGMNPVDLDGHSIEELSDYLDAGREPRDPSIENSPGCKIALDALGRLQTEFWAMIEGEAAADSLRDQTWITNVMANISRESRAGRDIPIRHPEPAVRLRLTEGSVRGLIRAAGDAIDGALIGKVELIGDVTVPGEEVTVDLTASAAFGKNLVALSGLIRANVVAELAVHTELNIIAVNVTVEDVHVRPPSPPQGA